MYECIQCLVEQLFKPLLGCTSTASQLLTPLAIPRSSASSSPTLHPSSSSLTFDPPGLDPGVAGADPAPSIVLKSCSASAEKKEEEEAALKRQRVLLDLKRRSR